MAFPTCFDDMKPVEVERIMRMMYTNGSHGGADAGGGSPASFINPSTQGSMILPPPVSYKAFGGISQQPPHTSRVSVWGQGSSNSCSTSAFSRPAVTVWGGGGSGAWAGCQYEASDRGTTNPTAGQAISTDDTAMWVQSGSNYGNNFLDPAASSGYNPSDQSHGAKCSPLRRSSLSDASVYQTLQSAQDQPGEVINTSQLAEGSSSHHSSLPYPLEPEGASESKLGLLDNASLERVTTSSNLAQQPLVNMESLHGFDPQGMQQHQLGITIAESLKQQTDPSGGGDGTHRLSHDMVLERLANYTLGLGGSDHHHTTPPSSTDATTKSACMQLEQHKLRYLDPNANFPLVVARSHFLSDHPLPVNSFENDDGQAQKLNHAYFRNPCDSFATTTATTTRPDQCDVNSMACLLLPGAAAATAVTSADRGFPFYLHEHWGLTQSESQHENHDHEINGNIMHGKHMIDEHLDLVELVERPLDQILYVERVKKSSNNSYLNVNVGSSVCIVPHIWRDGKHIRGIDNVHHGSNASFHMAEARLHEICREMRSRWQLGCIALAHR